MRAPAAEDRGRQPVSVRLQADPRHAHYGSLEVNGLPAGVLRRLDGVAWGWHEWSRVLGVHTVPPAPRPRSARPAQQRDDGDRARGGAPGSTARAPEGSQPGLPPVLGGYTVEDRLVRFTPRFPFVPGLAYRVTLDLDRLADAGVPGAGSGAVERRVDVPPLEGPPTTTVTALYPSGPTIPRNQLKLYLCFSSAMRSGVAFEKVHLVDVEEGRTLPRPFAEGGAELWDAERRRLTLILDPGRIKRGLVATEARGAALRAGRRYRLEVDPSWKDASGRPLASGFVQEYLVVDEDREVPDPRTWRVSAPAVGTREPLVVGFGEALDRGLLEGAFVLIGPAPRSRSACPAQPRDGGDRTRGGTPEFTSGVPKAERVKGSAEVGAGETSWSFSPTAVWSPGSYAVVVDPELEDLAGNEVRRPFDREVREEAAAGGEEPVVLRFAVR